MFRYQLFNWRLQIPFPVRGLRVADGLEDRELRIIEEEAPSSLECKPRSWTWTPSIDGGCLEFRAGRFLQSYTIHWSEGTVRLRTNPPEAAAEGLALLFPRYLLKILGRPTMHVSAVATDRGAFLFCGPSGRGKSTISAVLIADRRGRLLGDDFVECSRMLYPGSCLLNLHRQHIDFWRERFSRDSLDFQSQYLPLVSPESEHDHFFQVEAEPVRGTSVAAIFFLNERGTYQAPQVLNSDQAVGRLLACRYSMEQETGPEKLACLQAYRQFAAGTLCYSLTIPHLQDLWDIRRLVWQDVNGLVW